MSSMPTLACSSSATVMTGRGLAREWDELWLLIWIVWVVVVTIGCWRSLLSVCCDGLLFDGHPLQQWYKSLMLLRWWQALGLGIPEVGQHNAYVVGALLDVIRIALNVHMFREGSDLLSPPLVSQHVACSSVQQVAKTHTVLPDARPVDALLHATLLVGKWLLPHRQ